MTRWNWKRWAWAIAMGTTLAVSAVITTAADLPKAGETITLKYPGQPDRTATVVKSAHMTDGSIETEVKDAKSGQIIKLVDPAPAVKRKASAASAQPRSATPATPNAAPTIRVNQTSFMVPAADPPSAPPPPVVEEPRERRTLGSRLFPPRVPAAAAATPLPADDGAKKPGLLGRLFGRKPAPTPPAMTVMPATSMPVPPPAAGLNPPPRTAPTYSSTAEPPRMMPTKPVVPAAPAAPNRVDPVAPPKPIIPALPSPAISSRPSSIPVSSPRVQLPPSSVNIPTPTIPPPVATKSVPAPAVPAVPAPLPEPPTAPQPPTIRTVPVPAVPAVPSVPSPSVPTPTIPSIPTPTIPAIPTPTIPQTNAPVTPAVRMKAQRAVERVQPAGHAADEARLPVEIQPQETALKKALAPSARISAAKALAEGRYGSTEAVKSVLFQSAQHDTCPEVKACCLEQLCRLGYRSAAFMDHLKAACNDPSEDVRTAAKESLMKMTSR